METKLLTRQEYATYRKNQNLQGVSYQTVCKVIREGKIACVDGMIDPVIADQEWIQNSSVNKLSVDDQIAHLENIDQYDDIPDFAISKARIEATKAILVELELQEKQGELVKVSDVSDHLFDVIVNLKQAILLIPQRIAPILTSLNDITDIENELEGAITVALEQLSEQLSRGELLNKGLDG